MKTGIRLLLGINFLLIFFTILSYLSPFVNPSQGYIISFFGLAYPWLLLFNMCFVLLWWFLKAKYSLFSGITILLGLYSAMGIYGFTGNEEYHGESKRISIMSYNIQNARETYSKDQTKRKQKIKNFESFLDDFNDVEIVCIQEAGFNSIDFVDNSIEHKNKHLIDTKGTVIYSKYPIIESGQIEFGTKTNSCLWADIVLPKDTLRIYCVHLQSNKITQDTEDVMEGPGLRERETWKKLKGIFANYKNYTIKRVDQAKKIREHKKSSPYKSIVCGDLNDTPQSYVYREISKGMNDSFYQKGKGFGTTYAGNIPALRIDYILADKSIEILDHRIVREKHSDHFPIVSSVRVP